MRNDINLAAILQSVHAATPEPVFLTNAGLLTHPDPVARRAWRMLTNHRRDTFDIMVDILAAETETPEWIARLALDAAIPDGRERELDDPGAIAPALNRAKVAMGFKPCRSIDAGSPSPAIDEQGAPFAA